MPRRLLITTGARLHFGFLAYRSERGPQFGGVGVMIERPRFRLAVETSEGPGDRVMGDAPTRRRAEEFLAAYRASGEVSRQPPPCQVRIDEAIPPHAGLGSGTQLGLSIATALARLGGEDGADPISLAQRVGRGRRSAIGIHGFARGGLLLDGGKQGSGDVGALTARVAFPSAWRWLLVTPTDDSGLSGEAEQRAFARLSPMPGETSDRLNRIVQAQLLPAVSSVDFDAASAALGEFGRLVGEYFAPVQGGTFAHPAMRELAWQLQRRGIAGVAQSSWGPTACVLCRNADDAGDLFSELSGDSRWASCRFRVVAAMNTGAVVETEPPAA